MKAMVLKAPHAAPRHPPPNSWAPGVEVAAKAGAQAILVAISFRTYWMRNPTQEIVDAALKQRIPLVYTDRESVEPASNATGTT